MYTIQYLPYFIGLLFIVLPAVLLGLQERNLNYYGLSGSFLILLIVFGSRPRQLFYLLLSFLWSVFLIKTALLCNQKASFSHGIFYLFSALSLLPLVFQNFLFLQVQAFPVRVAAICFTLKTIQVLSHILMGRVQLLSLGECTGFLLFFPSLFLGPLNSSLEFHRSWNQVPSAQKYRQLLKKGVQELLVGILYLLFLARGLSLPLQGLEPQILQESTFWYLLFYAYLYSFHLFFILAGFSRIASGCSCLLGMESKTNFYKPFLSVNIGEFWRRWHITFTDWLREFIFSPFTGKCRKSRQFSCPLLWKCSGYLFTMGIVALIYGITPSSLMFALYHGLLLCFYEFWQQKIRGDSPSERNMLSLFFSWFLTLQFVIFGFFILSGMFLEIFFQL